MSAMPNIGRAPKVALATALAGASVFAITLAVTRGAATPRAHSGAAAPAAPAPLECRFEPGETAAFTLESTARDVRGEQEDHFRGTLSWQVVEQLPGSRWRLRAALGDVSHDQSLTLPEERVKGPITDPFFVDVDASCRFVGFGFARDWGARRRQFVRSLLSTEEFVLPAVLGTPSFRVTQSDGLGPFEASYALARGARASELRIERHKVAYEAKAGADAMGLSVVVVGSKATARFDLDHPDWVKETSGLERVQILVQGKVQADLLQRFRLVRDDARFVAMRAISPSDADFRDAVALEGDGDERADPELARTSYEAARRAFLAHFTGTGDPSYAAARELSSWLSAHPEGARRLVADLRAGRIDDAARPALFLGLELSGTDAARGALSGVLEDPRFRAVDRARAASALSDIGEPTRKTADLLLSEARNERDGMVANVSLLGVGSMARRGRDDGELRAYVHASLEKELSAAGDEGKARLVLDAMGNSGDPAFADELDAQLGADSAATRQHAADALGRLDPEEAEPLLLDRLRDETDPTVSAAIVGAMHGPPTPDAIALMADKLAGSTSISERAAIIAWLGAASRTDAAARAVLVEQFHRETNARLMQEIGAFLPASALR